MFERLWSKIVGKKPPLRADVPEIVPIVERYLPVFERTRLPFVRMTVAGSADDHILTQSKIGGLPYMPAGESTRKLLADRTVLFIAQIDLAVARPPAPFPQSGLLQLWSGSDDLYGMETEGIRCVYHEDVSRPHVVGYDGTKRGEFSPFTHAATGRALTFTADTELMPTGDYRWDEWLITNGVTSDLERLELAEAWDTVVESSGHRLGGYCAFTQEDPRDSAQPLLSLAQLDSIEPLMWGDAGIAHWWISEADLVERRFDRVTIYWDCG
jgi:uncharacterized protein YwqG